MDETERLSRIFKALGDTTRLRLIAELARRGTVTCSEFAALCDCSNSALTYHQRILVGAGLIAVRRAGQFRVLSLQRETFTEVLPGFLERLVQQQTVGLNIQELAYRGKSGPVGSAGQNVPR
jgi:DNA-binding transcriptional ArsR family regulator